MVALGRGHLRGDRGPRDQSGGILVDGLGVGDVGNIVLRDRQNLAQNGIIVVVLTLEKYSNQLLAGPDIVSRGFVYVRESEDLLEEAHSQRSWTTPCRTAWTAMSATGARLRTSSETA